MSTFIHTVEDWSLLSIILRLSISVIIGICIGIDREIKNRGAGIKTHVLVCIGSALVMLTSEYIMIHFPNARADMNRLGAQVISGVGFLGVGTIIVTGKNQVRGLTTAAGLWVSACAGLAIGIGFIEGTIVALILILFTLKVLNHVDKWLHQYAKNFDIYIEFSKQKKIREFLSYLHAHDIKYSDFQFIDSNSAMLNIELNSITDKEEILNDLYQLSYIEHLEEIE